MCVAGHDPFLKGAFMVRAARHTNLPSHRRSKFAQAAFSPAAKTAYAVIGTAGLAALAIAIFGPKRFQREILRPVQNAVGDQASQLWADSRSVREQISGLIARAQSPSGRDRLVQNFQSWIGHFKAG
jgi:NAD/NADP transhydrogenase alpha subunit